MDLYAGLDVGLKTTQVRVVRSDRSIVWRGSCDTHVEMLSALPEALAAVTLQVSRLDRKAGEPTRTSAVGNRPTSVPGVGPATALAVIATVEAPDRFESARAMGASVGLTPRRYPSGIGRWPGGSRVRGRTGEEGRES